MAAKMNDPNRVTRGTCPLTPTDAVNICAGNALVKLANVNFESAFKILKMDIWIY